MTQQFQILESHLPQICKAAGLEPLLSVTQLLNGVVNPAFCVNDKYIVRFNVRDLDIRKFKREEVAFSLLAAANVSVPKVIWLDESRSILNADILITERLPGESMSSHWKSMNNSKREQIATEAAKILVSIHNVAVACFGPLDPHSKKYASWNEYIGTSLQSHCRNLAMTKTFSNQNEIEQKIWSAFKIVEPLLASVTQPKLIHGDFHFANLVGTENKISGVVDFEWSIGGDPDMDFRNPTNINESAEGVEPIFARAYQTQSGRTPDPLKCDFYQMMIKLELIPVSLNHWVDKVPWGRENHQRIMSTFDLSLDRILANGRS